MDPSALIFVALAVAWAVYLIPKALEHHEESVRTRTVTRFSATMRVLAHREPVSRTKARLVQRRSARRTPSSDTPGRSTPAVELPHVSLDAPAAPTQRPLRRGAAARAAKRRLRVVTLILLANVAVAGVAAFHLLAWRWAAVPVAVLVAWLVACRLMVRRERRQRPRRRRPVTAETPAPNDHTDEFAAVPADESADPGPRQPGSWDPVPVTLPTYVSKPAAPRSVRTIDLDSTGVWSSGRNDADSALVRESHEAAPTGQETEQPRRRAVGD